MGGPSIDLGGGAISFVAATFDDADVLVASDPFVRADLISESRLKEWRVE